MMLPTHAVVGLAIAAPLLVIAPELATVALVGALVGSILPDLDMYTGHRRVLHYPTGYTIAAVPAVVAVGIMPTPGPTVLAFVLVGAAFHCRMDRYGGGLELQPWEATSERAVYDHVRGRWRTPKRWIRYDGAPEDMLLAGIIGTPLLFILEGPFRWVVVTALLIGSMYVLLRRQLTALAPVIVENLPASFATHVPNRYRA